MRGSCIVWIAGIDLLRDQTPAMLDESDNRIIFAFSTSDASDRSASSVSVVDSVFNRISA